MSSRHHFECRLFGKVDAGTKKLPILGWRFLGNIKDHGWIQLLFMEYFFFISGFLGKGYQNDDQLKVAIVFIKCNLRGCQLPSTLEAAFVIHFA